VFDNYDDPNQPGVKSSTGFDIRRFFPHRSQGSILITTRSHRLAFTKQLVLLKFVDLDQSLAVLASRSRRNVQDGKTFFGGKTEVNVVLLKADRFIQIQMV
jgi:hypothetical protein